MIELASMVEPGNVLSKELAIEFLSELDGMIQADIMLHGPEEIVVYDNEEQELLLRPPHDKIYIHYLVAMIRQVQQEFDAYNNAQEAVNEKLSAFETWYSAHYRPAVTMSREYMGAAPGGAGYGFAYLTAYGIAVKLGFEGTEAEWLLSLKGETGEAARMRYDAAREMIQWGVQGNWYDLMALQELWDPVAAAIIDKAETAAEQAQGSALAASGAADEAAVHADTARAAAGNAEGHARTALAAAADAAGAAGRAAGSADTASSIAREAAGSAQGAAAFAASAEAAAGRAEDAASAAQGMVENVLKEHDNFKYSHQDIRWDVQENKDAIDVLNRRKLDSEVLPEAIAGYLSENPITAEQVGAIPAEKYWDAVDGHNTNLAAHPYFHDRINELQNRLNTALNSDDIDLDQLAEIVAYIRSNRTLIDAITTSKVSVADIADDLVTDVVSRPLSAAQGVVLAERIEELKKGGTGNGSGQNPTNGGLTTAQVNALHGMFKVCAYDDSKDVPGAYSAFLTAFGLAGSGEEEPDEPVVPDIPDVPGVTQYTITNALTNVSTDNPVAEVTEGGAYMATLTADDGYTLDGGTVTVKMGGVDITATAYADGVLTIASVTGNVVITAVAVEVPADSGEVVMLKNISFDGTSYLDTGVIPESVNYRYVLGIQAPNKDIVTNKHIGGISMRDNTDPAKSAYWDIYWYCTVTANNYNADVPRVAFMESCMGTVNGNGLSAGSDKGDGASTQPFDYPVYYNLGNGSQSMWLNDECTEPPVTGHFAAATTATDFTNQSYYTDDEHPIDSIWLGKVHVTGLMGSLATEANTYAGVKFYCFKAYDSDNSLIADMRPAKQGGTVGMWDNVRNTFYPATGTANYEEVSA